jgi:hypothetical protein
VTARDLEAIARQNRIEQMIERAFEQARSVAQRVKSVVQRRHELIRELRFRKQQAKARKIDNAGFLEAEISLSVIWADR